MNQDILDLGHSQYEHAVDLDKMERDKNGFIILKPTAKHVDDKKAALTTDISSLEMKLKKFREQNAKLEKYQKSDDYKESKKKMSKKKAKKKKETLLEMVFNNADHMDDEDEVDEEDEENYRDSKKSKKTDKKKETTLDTTYGKRFSPVVAMLHDTIVEFDNIATDIENELKESKGMSKSMYRSSQISNLISAKNSKLSAVKELASVATTVSNLEYKKDKDRQQAEGSDSSRAISALGAKYLRGGIDFLDDYDKKGKKKKKGKDKDKDYLVSKKKKYSYTDDDDDEEDSSIKKQHEQEQRELASEFAKELINKKKDIKLSPHERYASMEGSYTIVVVADPIDPDNDWKFMAVDKKGKEIKNFKDDYPGLLPRKKNCRMTFDLNRLKAYDKNSARTYKLILKD